MKRYLLFFLITINQVSYSQYINFDWQNCMLGIMDVDSRDIVPTGDGYLVVAQYEKPDNTHPPSNSSTDIWLIKLDLSGNELWSKFFGGSSGDGPYRLVATSDGNYYIIVATSSEDGDISHDPYPESVDFWIVKIDAQGNKIWDKMVGGNCREYVMDGVATPDGGVVAMGYTCSTDGDITHNYGGFDIWAFKLDSTGTKVWDFTLGSTGLETGERIVATSDGGFLLSGAGMVNIDGNVSCTPHSEKYEALLVKIDSNGVMQWQRCYGGSEDDFLQTMIEVSDGYIVGGGTKSDDGDMEGAGYHLGYTHNGNQTWDLWLAKIDFEGNIIWDKCYGGSGYDASSRIFKTENNNYMIFGSTTSFDSDVSGNHSLSDAYYEIWVLKLSATGEILYQRCIGGNASENISSGVVQKNDSTYVVAATAQGFNTGDITCGPPQGYLENYIWAFQFTDTTLYTHTTLLPASDLSVTVKPNPAGEWAAFDYTLPNNSATALLTIIDAFGRMIETFTLTGRQGQKLWDTRLLPAGIYFYSLKAGTSSKTDKVIIKK
jgi:hypothetical protein